MQQQKFRSLCHKKSLYPNESLLHNNFINTVDDFLILTVTALIFQSWVGLIPTPFVIFFFFFFLRDFIFKKTLFEKLQHPKQEQ